MKKVLLSLILAAGLLGTILHAYDDVDEAIEQLANAQASLLKVTDLDLGSIFLLAQKPFEELIGTLENLSNEQKALCQKVFDVAAKAQAWYPSGIDVVYKRMCIDVQASRSLSDKFIGPWQDGSYQELSLRQIRLGEAQEHMNGAICLSRVAVKHGLLILDYLLSQRPEHKKTIKDVYRKLMSQPLYEFDTYKVLKAVVLTGDANIRRDFLTSKEWKEIAFHTYHNNMCGLSPKPDYNQAVSKHVKNLLVCLKSKYAELIDAVVLPPGIMGKIKLQRMLESLYIMTCESVCRDEIKQDFVDKCPKAQAVYSCKRATHDDGSRPRKRRRAESAHF